jgi:nucleoside-diphosphate-sugar epimerase
MKIFLAGASGAVGQTLIPLLLQQQHEVFGAFRNPSNTGLVQSLGATPVLLDALDPQAVNNHISQIKPQVVIHQLTAIRARIDLRNFDREFVLTNRLRTEGTRNLLTAAVNAGTEKFIAQGFAGWSYARTGAALKTEEDPLDPTPPPRMKPTLDALQTLESTVIGEPRLTGIVLRYGWFYGPHSSIASDGATIEDLRKRKVPLVGKGTGIWSFLHLHDAATATVAALAKAKPGIYNIVDDDPAPVSEWLPYLAQCAGAKPPIRVPNWLARLLIGEQAITLMNEIRGVSNAKAKRELNWTPKWDSWRQGFRDALN